MEQWRLVYQKYLQEKLLHFNIFEVSLGDIFVFDAPLDTIVVLVFCILHFFLHGGYY
jgi:hypothetical protein